uniref:Uncharacterized protein n=1 Tax=Panagrolaimus sp. ES5 TaxID=591445 RepID=A0AC34GWC2_9BILA
MRTCWKYDSRDRPSFYQILLYLKNTIDNSFKEFPEIREEGMKVFERSFVVTNYDDIDDQEYDFVYDEEEEDARKHTMLKELARMAAANGDEENFEYYKGDDPKDVDIGEEENLGEDEDAERFQVLALEDVPQTELLLEGPPLLTKKQIKERNKKREKFNKRQEKLEKEWQKKEEEENGNNTKYVDTIGLKDVQQKEPLLESEDGPSQSPFSTVNFGDGPKSITPKSQPRSPKPTSTPSRESKTDYTEIQAKP